MSNTFEINYNNKTINVKKRLNMFESLNFVQSLVYALVDENSETINYAWKEYEIRKNTILYYSDFKLPSYDGEDVNKIAENLNEIDSILFDSDIYLNIVGHDEFNVGHYNNLLIAIENQLNLEVEKIIKKSKLDELFDIIIGLVNKVDIEKLNFALTKLGGIKGVTEKGLVDAILDKKQRKPYIKKDKKDGSVIPIEKGQISVDDVLPEDKDGE